MGGTVPLGAPSPRPADAALLGLQLGLEGSTFFCRSCARPCARESWGREHRVLLLSAGVCLRPEGTSRTVMGHECGPGYEGTGPLKTGAVEGSTLLLSPAQCWFFLRLPLCVRRNLVLTQGHLFTCKRNNFFFFFN